MIIFAIYAMLVWYLVLRWRRRVLGFVVALGSGLAALAIGRYVPDMFASADGAFGMKWLIYAEAVLVGGMGLFIACLPRKPEYAHCPYCRYDLRGLDEGTARCPECGQPVLGREGLTPIPSVERVRRRASAAAEQDDRPQQQDPQRKPADQPPAQG